MSQMEDVRKVHSGILMLSGTFAVLVAMDLYTDYQSGSSPGHLALEGILLGISAGFFVYGMVKLSQASRDIRVLKKDLDSVQREKDQWKGEAHSHLAGLSVKIETQFERWRLTQAETEVGFLLLKGFSLKEIADLRNTKLKTVQQQSQSIYQKTGLGSRSELAAFFLEDLLPSK